MIRFKLLLLASTLWVSFLSAQTKYYIIDAATKEALPNILVHYSENSVYSNSEGTFILPEQLIDKEIRLDGLGYHNKTIAVSKIENHTISLDKDTQFLQAAILRGEPHKTEIVKQKHSKKNYWLDGVPHYHGQEFGLFIPKQEAATDMRLISLTIPIIKKNADWEKLDESKKKRPNKKSYSIENKRLGLNFSLRVQFYEMLSDSSFVKLPYPSRQIIVSRDETKYVIDYENDDIVFPDNGLLVSVLNMGPCDENGNMLSIPRFVFKEYDGRTVKVINNKDDVPLIALHSKKKSEAMDYFHSRYSDSSAWARVTDGLYPRVVDGPMKQLGLGYEIEILYYD